MAYRTLAKMYHPDTYLGSQMVAEEKMKAINTNNVIQIRNLQGSIVGLSNVSLTRKGLQHDSSAY